MIKMNKITALKHCWLVLLLLFTVNPVFAALSTLYPKEIKFQHILENRDIVVGEVRTMLQDSEGFMWFGGWNSLVRFDGYNFKQVYTSTEENGKIKLVPSTNHTALFESSDKTLWVGTSMGLLRYDPLKDNLVKLKDNPSATLSISSNHIMDIDELTSGEILVSSLGGIFIVDPKSNRYSSLAANPEKPGDTKLPSHANVNSIYIDDEGQIWLGTDVGLDKFDFATRTFTHVKPDPKDTDSLANWVKDIAPTGDGKLWLSTNKGVLYYDPISGKNKRYTHKPGDPNSLGRNDIWDIMVDSNNRLWVTSDQGGLMLYVPEKDHFIRYKNIPGKPSSLSTNVVRTIVEDNAGDLWMGFYPEGIDFFDQSTTAITAYVKDPNNANSISHTSAISVSEDEAGNLWVGTEAGINYFNRKTDKWTSYGHDPDDPNSLSANAVLANLLDSSNNLWMGFWDGGITKLDLDTMKFTRIPFGTPKDMPKQSKSLNSRHVWVFYEDSNKDLWVGTHTGGLSKYDPETGIFTHYWHIEEDETTINEEWVWSILEDSKNNFWVGTTMGVGLMDRKKGTFKRFVPNPQDPNSISEAYVYSIHEDKKGRLWMGTRVGLNLYNYDTQSFTKITTEDGLNNDSIHKILEDENGVLWLGTANGVSSYDPETKKIKNYNRDGGELVGGFNYGSGAVSNRGEIIFGGVNGLRIYKPEELGDNPFVPPVAFTQLKIYSDIIGIGGADGILDKDINYTDKIKLDYTKSMFEINFAALNFRDPGKNQYAYMLEGFDDEWLQAGDQRTAKYTNLDAGTYTFKVKASNNDGVWNEEPKTLTIVQLPPWWETWWAYSLYALTVLSLVAWAIQFQRKKRQRVEELNRVLETRVAERTYELRQKNHDIQSMLGNMRQGLFTIEKGGVIHPEYSSFLEQIFETENVAGQEFMEFLFSRSHLGSNELDQIKEATNAILGEDELNFEFNSHLFFDEYDADIEGKHKHLSIDWNPIVIDDVVTKLMISVRDVTKLKEIENEARTQKRELDIISQLLKIQTKKFNNFEKSVRKFIQENRNKITSTQEPTPDMLALLFRNMHTIKGNCRTYGFTYMSDTAHEVESTYSELKENNGSTWNADVLLEDLTKVESALAEYANVFRNVLGREGETVVKSGPGGVWLDDKTLQSISTALANIQLHLGVQGLTQQMQPIQAALDNSATIAIDEVLEDIIGSLGSIAEQLDKPAPKVTIDAGDIRLRENAQDLMNNIFSHILRNAVDHGIELPEVRQAAGKDAQGKIELSVVNFQDHINIHVRDDGRGLNIPKLKAIGAKLEKWEENARIDIDDIAQLIFNSGVSTAEIVTDISGRGVGMDAVKQYLLESGGEVFVNVLDEEPEGKEYVPFEVVVTLPPAFYTRLKKAS